ncbi:glycine zipper 2TM domain-containing protein [Lysobacter gummosus]|uniref:Glycine zipper 2TM domain-containing protein n=1 Tax=Lysobacter gummosus TaxID=262324 RepID=A0ABY3XB80_9GAMM|nr:glycine zipper 2TM domain-containing protein [Lysobacter gummosus]ALN92026.1 glycine zipper 2TM domain protein [Lysobacter gummosus]UNP27666.1 glycine zipper 2TM domain-containing protein [Lysobacter gummosus]
MNTNNIRLLGVAAAATLVLAGCATSPGYGGGGYNNGGYNNNYPQQPAYPSQQNNCYDCGVVTRIEQISTQSTAPSATGAVLGGLVGAVAGRKIADDHTDSKGRKNAATVGGAVAGALAGNAIQNRVGAPSYNVYVRMDDGRTTVVTQKDLGGIRENTYVRVANGRVYIR